MKIRIKFEKYGAMKFVGHLDMMRYFQKAMRRAHIDICYSEGFSPHQIMSFAAPLGVGITSEGEYFDIEVHSSPDSDTAIKALNDTMVEGIVISDYVKLPDNAKTAMSVVAAADYTLTLKEGYESAISADDLSKAFEKYIENADSFVVTKETKKGEREVDLKQLIYKYEVSKKGTVPAVYLLVSTGSTDNIKPEFVLKAIYDKAGITYNNSVIQIHRKDIYARADDGDLIPLSAFGQPIS
jgi:radical SAM-linked protein